ncbi:MAG: helix-turn-helix domain-containing protein [Chitinispirillales bacterium]|nr:helix-turn-helix domain-containing protein [Chitinispirillales bacterium]
MDKKKMYMEEFGGRVRMIRKSKRLSQEELAKLSGYESRSTINKIESGNRDVPLSKVEDIAKALCVTPACLMGWDAPVLNNGENVHIAKSSLCGNFETRYGQKAVELLRSFDKLNLNGKNKLLEQAEDLTQLPKYTDKGNGQNSESSLVA